MRAGLEPPPADTTALTAALAHHDALEGAYKALAAEANEAHVIARAAASQADQLIEEILNVEGARLAAEVIRTQEAHWQALDLLTGLVKLDDRRQPPQLRDLQERVIGQIDRRRRGIEANPLYVEDFNWRGYLEALESEAEQTWQDFRERLRKDPEAQLE